MIPADNTELSTKEKILRAAKQEFFNNGFLNANVRTIAEKAGVTTGALYHLFKNKDSLFDALTGAAFDEFLQLLAHSCGFDAVETDMKTTDLSIITEVSWARSLKMINFVYDNWDAMKLIVCCARGSLHEHIFDKAIDLMETETLHLLQVDGIELSRRIKFFIHAMVTSQFENIKEIFYHDLEKPQAIEYILDFNVYHCAGWKQYWVEQIKG